MALSKDVPIDHRLVELALDQAMGFAFEDFCQPFFAEVVGSKYTPLGGVHDGGADAFVRESIYSDERPKHFWQMSSAANVKSKIKGTIDRIKEFGREIEQLTYCTPHQVQKLDAEEDSLSEEFGIRVRIRDRRYIISHINKNSATRQAFISYLYPRVSYIENIGSATLISSSPELPSRSLCVFLAQEVERRSGNSEVLESVTDSLILWALEGTDPDKKIFLSRDDILKKIEAALPSAKQFIRGVLDDRLDALRQKADTQGREINRHPPNQYCLPYRTRQIVEQENLEDEALKLAVSEVFRARYLAMVGDDSTLADATDWVVQICHRCLQLTFERHGLELSYFMLSESNDEVEALGDKTVSDNLDDAIREFLDQDFDVDDVKSACLSIIRKSFYSSEPIEREYLSKLSRTYTLLFSLRNDPKVVEYFKGMSADLVLLVGTDLIVRAMSERYLPKADRMTWNLFSILRDAGAKLILTSMALNEIKSHLEAQDYEFKYNYVEIEPFMNLELARHIDRILIRSYFYARNNESGDKPAGWKSYISQFCTYEKLHTPAGEQSIKSWLSAEFGFEFQDIAEIEKGIDAEEVQSLTDAIIAVKRAAGREKENDDILSKNDALHALRVYRMRRDLGEQNRGNPYGFRVWWLTSKYLVRQATGGLVVKNGGVKYMIRPEFILNFIALSPTTEDVRESYAGVFPSMLGIKLSNRLKPDVLNSVMGKARDAYSVSEARALATVGELTNELKGDFYKKYENNFKSTA